ncbi:hypothetical protein B0T10DRAFT_471113 [Thelonectria olida]|uniref:Uncharacterized protein n=1 Tax=Thelonectria olida TaxID=1576542 RepID=A0A9P8WID7_9HYPO|nr:hypothetical protein B0T10DRAFT_471113 [Thelonectria olida]
MNSPEPEKTFHAYPSTSIFRTALKELTALPRLALIGLSVASFLPHYDLIVRGYDGEERGRLIKRGCGAVSSAYVLFNLIAATEQVALMLLITMAPEYRQGNVIRTPTKAHTWLNLVQSVAVCLSQLVLFGVFILYSYVGLVRKLGLILAYCAFVGISIVPVVFIVYPPGFSGRTVRAEAQALLAEVDRLHLSVISPGVTVLRIAGYHFQSHWIYDYATRSIQGDEPYGKQALVFFAVGAAWLCCFYLSPQAWKSYRSLGWNLRIWYKCVGWAAVDCLVFASLQGLYWLNHHGGWGSHLDNRAITAAAERNIEPTAACGLQKWRYGY